MVSNKKYKEALREKGLYQKWFYQEQNETFRLMREVARNKDEVVKLGNTNRELANKVDEYKHKFLDEQHKRLLLAEKVEQLEMKLEATKECGYVNESN